MVLFYSRKRVRPLRLLWFAGWFVLLNILTHGLLWRMVRSIVVLLFVLLAALVVPAVLGILRARRRSPPRASAGGSKKVIDVNAEVIRDE
ncbi:MAG: hypothetical protein NC924_07090 [Candidatus Omnitrophica bacterium]|nr:hypothetical protein [Candidatus Omnitrophota bacterium]